MDCRSEPFCCSSHMKLSDEMLAQHKTIARGMLTVMAFVILAKLVAMAKEMAIAWRFGVGEVVDGYLFVLNLVSWPVSIWLSVLAVVLVPLANRLRHEDYTDLPVFRAELFGLTLLIGGVLALVAWLGLPMLLRAEWLGLAPGVRVVALDAVPMLALVPLIGLPIGLYSVWMLSKERHANTLYEGLQALGILFEDRQSFLSNVVESRPSNTTECGLLFDMAGPWRKSHNHHD